jgi:hypothetical protein
MIYYISVQIMQIIENIGAHRDRNHWNCYDDTLYKLSRLDIGGQKYGQEGDQGAWNTRQLKCRDDRRASHNSGLSF